MLAFYVHSLVITIRVNVGREEGGHGHHVVGVVGALARVALHFRCECVCACLFVCLWVVETNT